MTKLIKWTPRILTIFFIVFLSIFAIDVFFEFTFPEVIVALFMHLIPSIALTLCLILAWKKPKWGGWPFIIAGLASIIFFNTYKELIGFLIISLPPIVIGIMFILSSRKPNN